MPDREDSILTLPGIGPKKAALFSRLGLHSLGDLLRFYPRDYENRTKLVSIAELEPGQPACFLASVISNPQTHAIPKPGRQRLEVTKVVVADDTQRLHLTFFNQGYLTEKPRIAIREGKAVIAAKPREEYLAEVLHTFWVAQCGAHVLASNYPEAVELNHLTV